MSSSIGVWGILILLFFTGCFFLLTSCTRKGRFDYIRKGFSPRKLMNYQFPGRNRLLRHWEKVRKSLTTARKERELYEGILYLKNLLVVPDNGRINGDSILEQLSEHAVVLKPVYSRLLTDLRMNRKEEGLERFTRETPSRLSREFGRLLVEYDQIPPEQLLETLISYQNTMKEVNLTQLKRRDEVISDLAYLPAVMNVLLIFVNFIYVAYFLDQKELLQQLLSL